MWPTTPLLDWTVSLQTPSAVAASTKRRGAGSVIHWEVAREGRARRLDQGPIPPAKDGAYGFVVVTVIEVLTARPVALCMECVLAHTGLRADHAIRQIVAARA